MTAHVIAFARHQILTTARLLDLHRAHKTAKRLGDHTCADTLRAEIKRRLGA